MGNFFQKYQILSGIVLGSIIIGLFTYFGVSSNHNSQPPVSETDAGTQITASTTDAASAGTVVPQVESAAQQNTQPTWHTVTSLSGIGQMNTAPFHIEGARWRIVWSCDTTVTEDVFGLYVIGYSTNGNDPGSGIVRTTCPYSGTNNYDPAPSFGPPGDFYLSIIADNINAQEYTSWKITVQELY
jgi:hypothetical protein